jgi:hypothetical protein
LTATVSTAAGLLPGGTVTFEDGSTSLATVNVDRFGQAIIATSILSASGSPHALSAVYHPPIYYYSSTGSLSQTVNRAPLTVMADNKSRVYGSPNPTLTASYSGFVNGDTSSVVSGLRLSTTATTSSGVGSYPITGSGASAANYTISYVNGTLTVTRAPLTITADNQVKVAGNPVPPLTASYAGFVNGDTPAVLTTPVSLTTYTGDTAGSYPIVPAGATAANYTITFVNGTLAVTPAAASVLVVSGFPTQVTAGDGTNQLTVTAYDSYGNVATGYSGTVTFSSSDGQASLPADTTLSNGTGTFSVTLFTAGVQSLTATDTVSGTLTGTLAGITVSPAAVSVLVVSGFPTQVTAGDGTNQLTVTAYDTYGNVATGYSGTVTFSSSDAQASLPADTTLSNGTGTFSVTLFTAGVQSLTATDTVSGTLTGTLAGITVTPAAASQLQLTVTASAASGTPFDITVTALDAYGNVDVNYVGTVTFTTSDPDPGVVLPANYTFSGTNAGAVTFAGGGTLITPGSQTLTVTDTGSGISGTTSILIM